MTSTANISPVENSEHKKPGPKPVNKDYQCPCGVFVTKHRKIKHEKTLKHRRFMGEEVVGKKLGRPKDSKKVPDKDSMSFILNSKTSELNEDQKDRRREYFRERMDICRSRRKYGIKAPKAGGSVKQCVIMPSVSSLLNDDELDTVIESLSKLMQ